MGVIQGLADVAAIILTLELRGHAGCPGSADRLLCPQRNGLGAWVAGRKAASMAGPSPSCALILARSTRSCIARKISLLRRSRRHGASLAAGADTTLALYAAACANH